MKRLDATGLLGRKGAQDAPGTENGLRQAEAHILLMPFELAL